MEAVVGDRKLDQALQVVLRQMSACTAACTGLKDLGTSRSAISLTSSSLGLSDFPCCCVVTQGIFNMDNLEKH